MTKKTISSRLSGNNKKRGVVLASVLFVTFALSVLAFIGLASIFSHVNLDKYSGEAENAARVCLFSLDNMLGVSASDPYLSCTSGQAFILSAGGGCVDDLSGSASSILSVGNNCSCAVFLSSLNATTYTVDASGRCWKDNKDRKQPAAEVIITADLATGTPPCTPSCPADGSVGAGGDCSDGCGNQCSLACTVGACIVNGTPPPDWWCQ